MEVISELFKEKWLVDKVYNVSDSIKSRVVDQTKFEERVFHRIGKYTRISEENIKNKRYIEGMIYKEASDYVKRYKNEESKLFTELTAINEDGDDEVEFEPVDVLANVESVVIKKETIDLLAKDDRRKQSILEAWTLGNTNDKQISRALACTFGGNPESQRKYIQRFRNTCREYLEVVI